MTSIAELTFVKSPVSGITASRQRCWLGDCCCDVPRGWRPPTAPRRHQGWQPPCSPGAELRGGSPGAELRGGSPRAELWGDTEGSLVSSLGKESKRDCPRSPTPDFCCFRLPGAGTCPLCLHTCLSPCPLPALPTGGEEFPGVVLHCFTTVLLVAACRAGLWCDCGALGS